ncbi:S-layer protein [Veillonellaceae bacterium WCA-693-APC-5D-A]|uniref:S-layer protein n=1 Tax=Anaerovibrio slackiae TaxID=2652309 RepID=A0A6I2UFW1_9FIRM|nr:S-layer homology domain-containing protein [Anaerovibrio slackiae]MSU07982.1 S-layer protein [Anaerovibrio slackiae]
MKKTLVSALTTALVVGAASTTFAAANPFADVPADHWAYDAVAQLVQDGVVNGYSADGTFKGDQSMSRYEMAQIVAKAMAKSDAADNNNKALIEKLSAEFSDELANLGVRVANLEAKTDNVKWNGLIRYDWNTTNYESQKKHRETENNNVRLRFEPSITINENWTGHARLDYVVDKDNTNARGNTVEWIYAEGTHGKLNTKIGRFNTFSDASHGLVTDIDSTTGIEFQYAPTSNWKVKATAARLSGFWTEATVTEPAHGLSHGPSEDNNATYWAVEANYQNGKWEAGAGYHNVTTTETFQDLDAAEKDGSFRVVDLGVGYAFDKNVKLTADYAFGPSLTGEDYDNASKNAYNIQLQYKGANAADKGSWGIYAAYRQLSPFAAFGATYDHAAGADGYNSLKGWEFGADYAFAKNIVATAKFFTGKDTLEETDKDKVTGLWSRVDFLF